MKKKKTIEVVVCGYCGKETNAYCVCGKSICGECGVIVKKLHTWSSGENIIFSTTAYEELGNICHSHIDLTTLKKLEAN